MATETAKVSGTILRIEPEQQITEKLRKQNLVLTTDGNYPQTIAVEFTNDKIDLLTPYAEGMQVEVSYNLRGREWNGKVFVNLDGWRIDRPGAAPAATAKPATANKNPNLRTQPSAAPIASDDSMDLPF